MTEIPSFEQWKTLVKDVQIFMPEEFLRLLNVEGLKQLAMETAYEAYCQSLATKPRNSELLTIAHTPAPNEVVQATNGVVSGGFVAMFVRGHLQFTYVEDERNKDEFIKTLLDVCRQVIEMSGGDFRDVYLDSEQN